MDTDRLRTLAAIARGKGDLDRANEYEEAADEIDAEDAHYNAVADEAEILKFYRGAA